MIARAFASNVLVAVSLAGYAALACGRADARHSETGTSAMADTLAALYRRAVTDPRANAFLNRERVAALQSQLGASGAGNSGLWLLLAREQLAAGRSREAIATLESLVRDAGIPPDRMMTFQKSTYDLLGIAWLRLGEQENCNVDPSADVCILPLSAAARHVKEEGARNAIAVYQNILRRFPSDYGSRWLLNLAHMAVGEYPNGVPPEYRIPGLTRHTNGAFPQFHNVAGNVGLAATGLAGGACLADFNGDGLIDLFKTSWGLNDPVQLFLADGAGGFLDRTAEFGLTGIVGGLNCVHADYDNDGREDVLILRGAWLGDAGAYPMSLLRNRGGSFEDVTFAAGLGSRHPRNSAAWADFDLDGLLDLFVGNESNSAVSGVSRPSELFRNNGDGTFTEVAHRVGLDLDAFVKGVVWGDVNNDGLPDLYASVMSGPNHLFLNRGGQGPDAWRFEDISASAGVRDPFASFPAWFWDYNNDGREDLLVLPYQIGDGVADAAAMEFLGLPPTVLDRDGRRRVVDQPRLYRNTGANRFADVTAQVGLTGKAISAMGANFGDLDNDGWLDFYVGTGNPDLRSVVPNRMFRSVEGRRFEDVTLDGGFGHLQKGHGTAFVDLDRDGDEDVFMVIGGAYQGDMFTSVLFENPGWPSRNWVTLEIEGAARPGGVGHANRSAIGARVELVVSDARGATRRVYRTVGTGGSFGSGSLQLHVGLGAGVRVRTLRIRWPDVARSSSTFTDLAVNRVYRVAQGAPIEVLDRPPVPFRQEPRIEARH